MQRFTHVAVTVPRETFKPEQRTELLAFYDHVLGWRENPGLAIPDERIFLRAPHDSQYVTVRASDNPMKTSGYEHLGVAVDSLAELRGIYGRARAFSREDRRVVLEDIQVGYGGRLHGFRVQFLLPLTVEVQFFDRDVGEQ